MTTLACRRDKEQVVVIIDVDVLPPTNRGHDEQVRFVWGPTNISLLLSYDDHVACKL